MVFPGLVQVCNVVAVDLIQRGVPGPLLVTTVLRPVRNAAAGYVNTTRRDRIPKGDLPHNRCQKNAEEEVPIAVQRLPHARPPPPRTLTAPQCPGPGIPARVRSRGRRVGRTA